MPRELKAACLVLLVAVQHTMPGASVMQLRNMQEPGKKKSMRMCFK